MEEAATDSPMEPGPITVADVGFATPESVLHDTSADVYLVSNINGAPLDADGNGFISRLSPEGEVLELKWIDGEAENVTLNAPKGMAIQNGMLYVTDIDCVRMFDAATGAAAGETCIEGATFLNDLAPHPEDGVLVSDSGLDPTFATTGTDAVYHLAGDRYAPVIMDPGLGAPNGLAVADGAVTVVTYYGGEIFRVDGTQTRTDVLASCVHRVMADGSASCMIADIPAPADIGVDAGRNVVMIPLFNANEVWIRPIG